MSADDNTPTIEDTVDPLTAFVTLVYGMLERIEELEAWKAEMERSGIRPEPYNQEN